jgi:predicted PurR-regulated permease PerM
MRSDTFPLPKDLRWRRLLVLGLFLGLLYGFRHLAPVLVFFVIFERLLCKATDALSARTGLGRNRGAAMVLGATAIVVAAGVALAVHTALPHIHQVRHEGREYLEALSHHPVFERLRMLSGHEGSDLGETAKQHAMEALHYATASAHFALYLLIGLLLAVIYLFERAELDDWFAALDRESIGGTLARWMGYLADAIVAMVEMQVVTAVVNALITLPVLVAIKLPHVALLVVLILVTGLVPIVGNFVAGTVLCAVAFEARGPWAVGVFLVVTFVLHKIEGYFLTPHLAQKHVKLPGLLLVVSLLLFEQAFGFAGLFLSFPALYLAGRIRNEWAATPAPND